MNRFNNRVPEFVVPKVPPKIDRVTSKDFKSMLETIPDNLTVYINGKLVTEINELNIDYNHYNANINLELEEFE